MGKENKLDSQIPFSFNKMNKKKSPTTPYKVENTRETISRNLPFDKWRFQANDII